MQIPTELNTADGIGDRSDHIDNFTNTHN